ncbi:MAG: hypothetical protein QOJ26_1100 [Thermoplasmata archaeon]|jgi:hypothetical protein|nr:hypothetical protein [Thermoplasmata archaeon]MEA3166231.1 hypothetical protein [Thermoplasmata archaeon]
MDETPSASSASAGASAASKAEGKPARRPPAQKAAHEAGLAGDVFLHKDALGGFTESGRKPKRLKPGDLTEKKPRKRKSKVLADAAPKPTTGQRELPSLADAIGGDDIVVIPSIGAAGRGGIVHLDEMDELPDADEPVVAPASASLHDTARATLAEAVFHEVGKPGSLLKHPTGIAFQVRPGLGEGNGHTNHKVLVPLPGGHVTGHTADLAVELEGGALLVLDVLTSESTLAQVKAHAFDALQLRGISSCYAVLVFVQGRGGLEREQVESVCHGYDHFFGVDADHAREPTKYTALRSRVASWIKAANRPA